jgi:hypothetical protein
VGGFLFTPGDAVKMGTKGSIFTGCHEAIGALVHQSLRESAFIYNVMGVMVRGDGVMGFRASGCLEHCSLGAFAALLF